MRRHRALRPLAVNAKKLAYISSFYNIINHTHLARTNGSTALGKRVGGFGDTVGTFGRKPFHGCRGYYANTIFRAVRTALCFLRTLFNPK